MQCLERRDNVTIKKNTTRVIECTLRKSGDAEGTGLENEAIKVVDGFCYLDGKTTSDCRSKEEIKFRMATGRKALLKKKNLLTSNINISVDNYYSEGICLGRSIVWE